MAEIGIDLSTEQPKKLTTDAVEASDVVITMGCGDACPIFPGKRYLDWQLTDPAGKSLDADPPHPRRDHDPSAGADRRAGCRRRCYDLKAELMRRFERLGEPGSCW